MIMPQSKLFDTLPDPWDDMSHGVAISFPILGIKGGKWHYRWKGEDTIIPDASGRFAAPAVNVVILNAQRQMSRTFYASGYVEGVNNPPDCWSSDGIKPDDTVANPINPICGNCPNAAWKSGATPAAPNAQACQQRRRTVVVPYVEGGDLTNELGGGPMLLSVPPGSLSNQAAYTNKLKEAHAHYAGCVTELSFSQESNVAFPKIVFTYIKPVTDEEAAIIIPLRESEMVTRIFTSKINVDGPNAEVDGADPATAPQGAQGAPQGAAPRTAQSGPPKATASVRPPATAQTQAAPKAPTAQAPAAPPSASKVGGFGVGVAQAAAAAPATAASQASSAIAEAVGKPAAPPPSARTVQAPAATVRHTAPAVVEEPAQDATEEAATEGRVPDEMTVMFQGLMSE